MCDAMTATLTRWIVRVAALRFGVLGAASIAPTALFKPAAPVDGVEVMAIAARDPRRRAGGREVARFDVVAAPAERLREGCRGSGGAPDHELRGAAAIQPAPRPHRRRSVGRGGPRGAPDNTQVAGL